MKTLYFDCSSGISGNMTLGALLEIVGDENYLLGELKKLNVDGYKIEISKKVKNGITGTYVDVILENEHHHHDHDHHEHGPGCTCGCHDHDHHHDHHADEVFTSWGKETAKKFADADMEQILKTLADNADEYGIILRAKGIVPNTDGEWIHFDLTPGEYEIRKGAADYTGKLCVIGSNLKEDKLAELFGVA